MRMLVEFMNNPAGRLLRIALGVALIVAAFTAMSGAAQWAVAAVGLVPIGLGLSGRCLIELIPGARR
ncbi:MAG: DUF2892 domain-containing protein [Chloroflexi bacterium]|nr:DUF2892 domain-containing protein [Chloroflexota bacterium]